MKRDGFWSGKTKSLTLWGERVWQVLCETGAQLTPKQKGEKAVIFVVAGS